jgi:exopolysaccharide biosynthesis polyprenyl glycosylphosphotransferase
MPFRKSTFFFPVSVLVDTLSINTAFILAYYIKFHSFESCFKPPYLLLFSVFNAAWFLLLLIVRPFQESRITFNFFKLTYKFIIVLALHIALISLFWVSVNGGYSRLQLFFSYSLAFGFGIFFRAVGVLVLKYIRLSGYNIRRYAILGYGELSKTIHNYYTNHPEMGYEFCGYFDKTSLKTNVGTIEELNNKILDNEIDYVYCCLPYTDNETLKGIIELSQYKQCNVKLLMDFRSFMTKSVEIEYHDYLPIINVNTSPFADTKIYVLKRMFDIIFSILVLLLGLPLYTIFAIITKVSSNGPVFYSQERIGQWGVPFKIYKFRSMYIDSENGIPQLSKGDNDNRITPWGRFMRKTRIDELPQFYNVLIGDMSIVGPRPERQYFIDQIIIEEPNYLKLLVLKPGITSIGQVKYGYASSINEMIERLNYDLKYLPSIKQDLFLIYQTLKIVVKRSGK